MINYRQIETIIVEGLKTHLGCEVIMANQSSPIPKYPFVTYTVSTPRVENNGTYGEFEDGVKRKEYQQIWSFTGQSDSDTESKMLAFSAHEYFSEKAYYYLGDNGIAVQLVGNITCRDNFLTTGYEYRNGFDITIAFADEIILEEDNENIIESISIIDGLEVKNNLGDLNAILEERLDGDKETEWSLEENIKQAVSDFDEIEKALKENGITIPAGVDTKDFANLVRRLGNSIGTVTLTRYTEADIKDGES